MPPAQPLSTIDSAQSSLTAPSEPVAVPGPQPVSQQELNAWRRGFTPQAEIWNGRLAMLGLSVGLAVLLLTRIVAGSQG